MEVHELLAIQRELSRANLSKRRMCAKNVQHWTQRMECGRFQRFHDGPA